MQCFAQEPIKYFVKRLPDSVFFINPMLVDNDKYITFYSSNTSKAAKSNIAAYGHFDTSLLYNINYYYDTTVEYGGVPMRIADGFIFAGKFLLKYANGQKRKFEFRITKVDFKGNMIWEKRLGSKDTINQFNITYGDIWLFHSFVTDKYTELLWHYVPSNQEAIYMRFNNINGNLIDSFRVSSPILKPIDSTLPNIRFYYQNSRGEISIFQQWQHNSTRVFVLNKKTKAVEYKTSLRLTDYYDKFFENGYMVSYNEKFGVGSEYYKDVLYIYSGKGDGLWRYGDEDSITMVEMNTYRVFRKFGLKNYRRNAGCSYQDNYNMKILEDGSIILSGRCYDFMSTVPFIAKYDINGNKQWFDILTGADVTLTTNVEIDSDGGIVFIAKGESKNYLVKYNPYGQLLDWIDSTKQINGEIVDRYYPNPVDDFVTLIFKQNFSGHVLMFDIYGRQLLNETYENCSYYNLFLPHYPAGQYMVQVQDTRSNIIQIFKIIKL